MRSSGRTTGAIVGAIIVAGGLLAGAVVSGRDGASDEQRGARPNAAGAQLGVPADTSLPRLVADSTAVVVGTVTRIDRGRLSGDAGDPYALMTVRVEATLRGSARDRVVAFDYAFDPATTTSEVGGPLPVAGQRLLLFLSDPTGTVHAGLRPAHLQVTGGAAGRLPIVGGEVQGPFTLGRVRAELASAS